MELYTYRGDLVVDPFVGSGSTLVAALRCGRDAVGYDLDPDYVALARERLAAEAATDAGTDAPCAGDGARPPRSPGPRSRRRGSRRAAQPPPARARPGRRLLRHRRARAGRGTSTWPGPNSAYRGGMARSETVWRTLGRAHVLAAGGRAPLVVLTTQLPRPGTEADRALRAPGPGGIFDAVDLLSAAAPNAAGRLRDAAAAVPAARLLGRPSDVTPGAV